MPDDYVYLNNWCGPMYNSDRQTDKMLWEIDSQWSSHGEAYYMRYHQDALRVLALYNEELTGMLSKADYVWLTERGYVKTNGDYDGHFKSAWQIVILDNREIQTKLLVVGDRLKEKYKDEFDALKSPYTKAVLDSVPTHLKKIKEYELQFVYHSDGWFLIHCIHALLNNGKLQLPTENQRRSLTTLIAPVISL